MVNWKNSLTKWLGLSKSKSEYHDHHHQPTKLLIVPDTYTLLCFLLYDLTKPDYKEALSQITLLILLRSPRRDDASGKSEHTSGVPLRPLSNQK